MNWMWETPALGAAVALVVFAVAVRGLLFKRDPETRVPTRTGAALREENSSRPQRLVHGPPLQPPVSETSTPQRVLGAPRVVITIVEEVTSKSLWVHGESLDWAPWVPEWFRRLALLHFVDVYFILRVRNDQDCSLWYQQVGALCRSPAGQILDERKFLVCDTAAGAAAMVRQLEPSLHLESLRLASECAVRLHRFIPKIIILAHEPEHTGIEPSTVLEQFTRHDTQRAPFRTAVAVLDDPMAMFANPLWQEVELQVRAGIQCPR
ncbi:hypothetical protein CYME_CMD042C [Cyanidioschyzon merolae strain 10D]|jgi:hypothetical protein|uniref:Uncharacterized protein n=1 Tax=Cyanidioschyzon merolae (strain NIES-3377 / 10D) TaxID=280699 RepID=M1V445_CYAM1|nr:hypothetical protein CYME_CMD042C [Cyanidioschyzon merolae strain 10D]BAM79130.1 hypothetical protein CYME_CMD042C [Cyanidioschyzon merolae strain 10D]|eukprot:XP_005535416.1 hypothetical protein CYME_CMD042C [Cyanidioschyzon merolae strain 10D]